MTTKVFKLFGVKVWETTVYDGEAPIKKVRNPQGEVLEYSQAEADKDHDREVINKMNGNT